MLEESIKTIIKDMESLVEDLSSGKMMECHHKMIATIIVAWAIMLRKSLNK